MSLACILLTVGAVIKRQACAVVVAGPHQHPADRLSVGSLVASGGAAEQRCGRAEPED